MVRTRIIDELADMLADIHLGHPVKVGIDGVSASGKTILADELVAPLKDRGRKVIRASLDGFHNPAEFRKRRGAHCHIGYYEDSFNHDAIVDCVLAPLSPGGSLKYKQAHFDFRTDSKVDLPWLIAEHDAILIFEGVFLLRPELREHWDFSIFVEASFEVIVERACQRDEDLFGGQDRVRQAYKNRYIPGQKFYLETERPQEKAHVVFANNDVHRPSLSVNAEEYGCV